MCRRDSRIKRLVCSRRYLNACVKEGEGNLVGLEVKFFWVEDGGLEKRRGRQEEIWGLLISVRPQGTPTRVTSQNQGPSATDLSPGSQQLRPVGSCALRNINLKIYYRSHVTARRQQLMQGRLFRDRKEAKSSPPPWDDHLATRPWTW